MRQRRLMAVKRAASTKENIQTSILSTAPVAATLKGAGVMICPLPSVEMISPTAADSTRMKDVARGGSHRLDRVRSSAGVIHHTSRVYVKARAVASVEPVTLWDHTRSVKMLLKGRMAGLHQDDRGDGEDGLEARRQDDDQPGAHASSEH